MLLAPPHTTAHDPAATPAAERPGGPSAVPPLPPPAGPPRAVLMLVRPRLLFAYWVLDDALRARIDRGPGSGEMRLETSADGRRFREAGRRPFDFRAPSWYVENCAVDCFVRVRLGMVRAGRFDEVLVSNALRVPREGPGAAPEVFVDHREVRRGGVARAHPAPAVAAAVPRAAGARATSPGRGPGFRPGPRAGGDQGPGPAGDAAIEGGAAAADLCFVLHSHLPFVRHPERDYFLEETWLFEAITETYLPILDLLEHLAEDEVPARLTMSLTPTLTAMLRDPLLLSRYERHLDRSCILAGLEVDRTRRDPDFGPVAGFYRDRLERLRFLFARRYGRDLVGRFASLQAEGRLELLACAATHGLLPLLAATPESVRVQVALGAREHRRQIGAPPRGMWLPECAYFEGLDRILADEGIEYVFADAHAIGNATSRPRLGVHAPIVSPAGVCVFGRDEECSEQVWSSQQGYPGDPSYRDFYRDIGYDLEAAYIAPFLDPSGTRGFTGLKYHRITGRHDDKEPYRREWALRTLEAHADDFVRNRRRQAARLGAISTRRPVMVAMYDAELFGHWWFEGPEWLEAVLRRLPAAGLAAATPADHLASEPVVQAAGASASSWGEGGYHEVWLREANDWIYPPLHDAARRMADLAAGDATRGPVERRALAQAGRELLLAQASDWPFIMKHETAVGYARGRVLGHLEHFDRLARQIEARRVDEGFLASLEARDNLFPNLDGREWGRA